MPRPGLAFRRPPLIVSRRAKEGGLHGQGLYGWRLISRCSDPAALAEYAKLAGPAIAAGGGRFLARGTAAKAYEKGLEQRTVLIEFDSVDKAPPRMTARAIRPP